MFLRSNVPRGKSAGSFPEQRLVIETKTVLTFGARALVSEHRKKIVLCSDTGDSKAPGTM